MAITPCRLFDTRPAPATVGPRTSPLGPAETYSIQVIGADGNCNIPSGALAVSMNTTAVNGTASSFLTVFPADATMPLASSLNWVAGQGPTPNQLNVTLAADGRISLYNNTGLVDVLGDVVGYYENHNHDDETTPRIISFPAEGLNISGPPITRSAGLLWPYTFSGSAELGVHRPADYVPNTAVTMKVLFQLTTAPVGTQNVGFFARPRDYNPGDPFLDPFGTQSPLVPVAATFTYYEATMVFPSNELLKQWWGIILQRNQPITNGYAGDVRVMSVELSYTGYVVAPAG